MNDFILGPVLDCHLLLLATPAAETPVTEKVLIALIAGGSGLLGALIGAAGATFVEWFRLRDARHEKRVDRQAHPMRRFNAIANHWIDHMKAASMHFGRPDSDSRTEAINRAKQIEYERREALADLKLHSPEGLRDWIRTTYQPAEEGVTEAFRKALDEARPIGEDPAAERYKEVLEEMVDKFREELDRL